MPATTTYTNSNQEADRQFFSPTTSVSSGILHTERQFTPSAFYYLVNNDVISPFNFESDILKASDFINYKSSLSINQFDTISLASFMFGDCVPLEGKPLEILKKTARRVLSKEPTKFPRNK